MSLRKLVNVVIVHNKSPKTHDLMSIQCRNICNELEKLCNLKINWILYPPAEIPINSKYRIQNIENYKSILDIIREIKPDIVIINGSFDFHNIETALAVRAMNIPLAVLFLRNFPQNKKFSKIDTLYTRIKDVLSNKIIAVHKEEIEQPKFYLIKFYKKRYLSLYNILQKTKQSKLNTIKFLIHHATLALTIREPITNIIMGDLNFCATDDWKNLLIDAGFVNKSIFQLGDPYFDDLFHDITSKNNGQLSKNSKIKLIFCTSTMHEHGLCSKNEEFSLITNVINKILENDKFELVVKIHPGTSSKKEYESEILKKTTKPVQIIQKENLIDLVKKSDVLIGYGGTSAMLYGILVKKPVINLDFNIKATGNNVWRYKDVIFECNNIEKLNEDIDRAVIGKNLNENINQFIEKHIGVFDGSNSKRVAKKIFSYLETRIN